MAAIELKLNQRTNQNNTSNISNQISMFLTSKIEKKIKTSYTTTTTTTTTTTVQHQSNNKAPSFNWDRLLTYIIIKSMEEYHNHYQQQFCNNNNNNNKEYQYHNQYLEQQQSISLLTITKILIPTTTTTTTTNNIQNEYKKYNKKNNFFIYKKNQQEALLSSYLSSLEKFESFQKYKFILPSSLSIIETVTSVILTSLLSSSSKSTSTSSSSIIISSLSILSGKRILKNSMTTPTTVIINIIKFQNNNNNNILLNENNILTNIDDIQMTSNLVNIINIDINDITNKYTCYNYNKNNTNTNIKYINTNRNTNNNIGIVINILIKYYNSDDSDVSDCKFINIRHNDICNNYTNNNNNNIIKNYLNNYHSYKIINFCSLNNLFFIKYIIIKLINLNNIILKIITKQITEQINNNNNNDTINNDTGSDVTVIINKNSVTTNENIILNSAMQILIKNINALNANTDTEDSNLKINNTIKSNNKYNNIIINNNNNNEYIKNVIKFPVNYSKLNPNSNNSPNNYNINNINNLVMKNNLINIHKINNNNNIKKENSIKNTTILPTRLKFNNNNYIDNYNNKTNEINNIDSSINNIKNINNNNINYNINYKYKLINSKFGWCCWHNINYIFSIFLLILIGLSSKCLAARNDVGKECTFPALWEGSWFLSGSQQSVHIKGSQFSYRGKCKAVDGNKYLIVNNNTGCHRCLVIYEKHKNVLQYKESECEGDSMYMDQSINPAAMPMRTIVKSSDNSQHSHLLNIRGREAHPTSYGHSQFSSSDRYIMRSNDDNNDCFCRGREILRNLCDQIPGDAQLYSLFREQAEPVKCPLRGPFTFTYNRGHGECKNPVSNIESCTDESRLLLNFQACPDVQGTESAAEELTCLATWKDGNSRYLVGLVTHHHAISNEERYRCFVYEKISTMMGGLGGGLGSSNLKDAEYKLAQSGDATCNGLDSAEVGSRIMTLRKPPPAERCDFPTWFKGPRHWHGLMGKSQYTYHQSDGSLIIKRFNSNYETRAFCEQINKQTSSEMIAVVHHTTGCQSGFMCMMFYRRDTHIAEIQLGAPANRLEDACAPDHFDITKLPYITLLSNEPTDHTCPLEGLYKLHGAIGPPHKISRHKRNHNNKGHNQHNHHHNIQLFQQQQQELIQQQQHAFVYSHNKRNVEHELSSASLVLSTSLSGSGIPSSSSSSSSILPSSSSSLSRKSTAMSSGIKRHGTFIFENSDETTQQSLESPQLPPEPPLVLAIAESGILSSSQSSSSASASASSSVSSTLSSYNQHFVKNNNNNNNNNIKNNNNNENGIEINENSNGMDDDIHNYRQMYNTKSSNIRNRRETNLFNRIDSIDHLQILTSENTAASSSSSLSTSFHSNANDNDNIDNGHANLYSSSDTDDVLSILKINQTKTGIPSHQETTITNLNANSNLYQQQKQQQQPKQQQQHNKKELRFNKKLIKDIIQMQKSLKMMSSQQQQQQQQLQQQKQKSRRHEIENLSSSDVQLSLQSISQLASPSTNFQLSSLSNGSNKNNNYENIYNVDNNNNNNNKSNDNDQFIVKINNEQHQSRIEILNQRSRRDTPGCIVNYKEQRYFTIGCNDDKNVIEVETKQPCDLDGDEVYYCHGHWSENGTIYVIAKNSATSHAVCITYQPQDGISGILGETKLMIVGDSCIRGQMKPPEHHLVATIKRAGKCGDPSSSTIHSTNLLLFIITVGCTILFTNR